MDFDLRLATDTLWSLWFRADAEANNRELQRLMRLADADEALAGFDQLVRRSPGFAEAYNQRAIVQYRRGEFARGVADCEAVLRLNPHHFGAAAGMGQCYVRLNKPRAAVRAFQQALDINPELDDLKETISALKRVIEGRDGG